MSWYESSKFEQKRRVEERKKQIFGAPTGLEQPALRPARGVLARAGRPTRQQSDVPRHGPPARLGPPPGAARRPGRPAHHGTSSQRPRHGLNDLDRKRPFSLAAVCAQKVPSSPGLPRALRSLTVSSNGSASGQSSTASALTTLDPKAPVFRLAPAVRRQLCHLLDPPNARCNDWRMLAQRLSVDRFAPWPPSSFFPIVSQYLAIFLDLFAISPKIFYYFRCSRSVFLLAECY